ncbi:MAG: hypothetical protein WBG08_03640 [Litorimonas sp.]
MAGNRVSGWMSGLRDSGLLALVTRGSRDTLIQLAATTLSRLGLAIAVLALAPFVSLEDLGRFDLFVVWSSFALLAVTIGMDSGLAIVPGRRTARVRRLLLVVALLVLAVLSAGFGGLILAVHLGGWLAPDTVQLAALTFGYGALNGALTLVFQWLRWQGMAVAASLVLLATNLAGFAAAALAFIAHRTIMAFMLGVIAGSAAGLAFMLLYLSRAHGFGWRDLRTALRGWILVRTATVLLKLSVPYVTASLAVISRRLIDRQFVLALGDPALLGAYAIIARIAELVAFAFAVPSIGFAPILVSRHDEAGVRRLGRILYLGYLACMVPTLLSVWALAKVYMPVPEGSEMQAVTALLLPILLGTLFLGEMSIAGFGYVLRRRAALYSMLSVAFPLLYVGLLWATGSQGVIALGWSFAVSAFLFSTAMIAGSERLRMFGYPLIAIMLFKLTLLAVVLAPSILMP